MRVPDGLIVVEGGGRRARSGSPRSPASRRSAPSSGTCGWATRSSRPRSRSSCRPSGATAPRAVLKITFPEHETRARGGRARPLERRRRRAAARGRPGARGAAGRAPRSGPEAERLPDEAVANTIAAGVLRRLWSRPPAPDAPFMRLDEVVELWAAVNEAPAADPAAARRPRRRPRPRAAAEPRRAGGPAPGLPHRQHAARRAARLARDRPQAAGRRARVRLRGARARPPHGADATSRDRSPASAAGSTSSPSELELDRERIRGWAVVHAVAWGGETGPGWDPAMVACANWLAEA